MPILKKDDKTVLFIHIPKCAGTSVTQSFEDNGWEVDWMIYPARDGVPNIVPCNPQHYHSDLIDKYLDVDIDAEFTVVRNPFKRLISEMFWNEPGIARNTKELDDNFWNQFQTYMVPRMSEFIVSENYFKTQPDKFFNREISFPFDNHMRPQWHFLREDTQVFKIEKMSEIEKHLESEYNIPAVKETNMSKNKLKLPDFTEFKFPDRFKDLYSTLYGYVHDKFGYKLPYRT